jgi:hypothetical protein
MSRGYIRCIRTDSWRNIPISLTTPPRQHLITPVTGMRLDSGLYSDHGELGKTPPSGLLVATDSLRRLPHCYAGLCSAPVTVPWNFDDVCQHRRYTDFVRCVRVIFSPRRARVVMDCCRWHCVVVLARPSGTVLAFLALEAIVGEKSP